MKIKYNFWVFNIYFKKTSLITIFIRIFWKIFIKIMNFFLPFETIDSFFMDFLFALACLCIAWHVLPLIPFSTTNNISISVNNSNFTPAFFKQACYANPGADKKWAESNSYISIHLLLKFSITSATNNVSLWTLKSW